MSRSYVARVVVVPEVLLGPPMPGPIRIHDQLHGCPCKDWSLLDDGRLIFECDTAFIFRVGSQIHLREGGRILAVGVVEKAPDR